MSRILRHVGHKDFQKTRQRQISEEKERAAQKLKEWQEAEAERKQIEEASRPYKSNWRRENLREFGEWAPIETSGPTNSTSTTFGYFAGGSPVINGETGQQVTFTYSGLDGIENYPTSVTIDQGGGDVFQTAPPPFSQIGVQGYTAKLNPRYKEAQKKYQEEMKEWERKKEQQQKDIEATLKSFGTSYRDVQRDGGITRVGNSYVAIIPTNTRDFGSNLLNNVRVVRLVPCDPSQPMKLTKNVRDISGTKKWNVSNAQYSHDVYLQIGEQPKAPMEQEYLIPRRTDFKDVNPQLDASQEFAQKVGADTIMNARVQSGEFTPEQTAAIDAWNAKLRAMMDKHQKEWDALGRRGYTKKQEMALANKQAAEINPLWDAEPKFDTSTSTSDPYSIRDVNFRTSDKRSQAAARRRANQPYSSSIPILDYGTNIARSIIANKPIRIPQSRIPQDHIDKLVQGISNSSGTLYSIPINTKEQPYSDENIYELPTGEVRTHTAGTKARYPDNTMLVDYNNLGFHGINNPLAAAGQAQLQFVRPKKGEPYLVYTDHAYRNLTSTDSGEATNNFLIKSLDKGLHTILGKGDPNEPNTGAMANYPPNIKGDVRKQIRVPYSQLPQNMKDRIDSAR